MDTESLTMYFRALLDRTRDHLYFKDRDSRFVLVSSALAKWVGADGPDALIGKTDADLFAPEHAREARADEELLLRGERSSIVKEEREVWPDGRSTWVSTAKFPLVDSGGRVIGTFGLSRDITARKQAEAGLLATDERLRELENIINQSPAVVFHWNDAPGWPVRYVSDNVRQFGYVPEEFLSGLKTYEDIIHPDDRAHVNEEMARFRAEGRERYALSYRILRRTGEIRWVEERGLFRPGEHGERGDCQGIVLDVTDRQAAEAELDKYRADLEMRIEARTSDLRAANAQLEAENERRRSSEDALKLSEQRYRRLLESVTSYVYVVAFEEGRPVSTRHGPGCEAVTGYRPEDYDARPFLWIEMVHPDDRDAVRRQAAEAQHGNDPTPLEHRLVHKNGGIRWVRNTIVPRRDDAGRQRGYDGLVQDITEQHIAQEARLKAERDALEAQQREVLERTDRLSALGLLAAGVAHEVNNPLQGMLTHLDAVRRALPTAFERRKSLDMVERGIESIASLVQRLLWLGSSGGDDGAETSKFSDAVSFVADLMGAQLQKRKIHLHIHARSLHIVLPIPHREMVQVLINLLMNARDAMPEGGTVTLTCDREGADAVIALTDTGPGIPADLIGRIFTPFFSTKGAKGTGLGLSVADSLVRAHGGRIWAESPPEGGARMCIRLPVVET